MSQDEFVLLRGFIHEKTGIYLSKEHERAKLEQGLQHRLAENQLDSFGGYTNHLKFGNSASEMDVIIDVITVKESHFFRYPDQMEIYQKLIKELAQIKLLSKDKTIKIWSAGCSTGEEPYTLAMIALETIPFATDWNIEIIANDICHPSLEEAKKGVYSNGRLFETPENYLKKYFLTDGDTYTVKKEVKNLVTFKDINLMDNAEISKMKGIDIIFCRNVLIYFSDVAKTKVIRALYNSLAEGGYYFTGHVESFDLLLSPFKFKVIKEAMVYQKEE